MTPSAGAVTVVGQVARDLVLRVPEVPGPGGSVTVRERFEQLGGKAANQAVGLTQLRLRAAVVGVVGDDDAGAAVLAQARADGLDVGAVVRRAGTATALLLDLVDDDGRRRLLEHTPQDTWLTVQDVHVAEAVIARAGTVVVQLQQPAAACLTAARIGRDAGRRVVLDGGPPAGGDRDALLGFADVLRADRAEGGAWLDREIGSADDAVVVGRRLLDGGPRLVALAAGEEGNVLVWAGGHVVVPLGDAPVRDRTGGGDAFVAGLVAALASGAGPEEAGRVATEAAAATVTRTGGRPDLAGLAGLLGAVR